MRGIEDGGDMKNEDAEQTMGNILNRGNVI